MFETYGETDSPKEGLCLTGTAGEKTVWAAANAPDLSGIGHLSDLKSATVRLDGNSTDPGKRPCNERLLDMQRDTRQERGNQHTG